MGPRNRPSGSSGKGSLFLTYAASAQFSHRSNCFPQMLGNFADFRRHKSVQIEPVVIPQRIKLGACHYVPFVTCVHSMFCTPVRRTLVPRGQFFIIRSVVQFTFSCAPVSRAAEKCPVLRSKFVNELWRVREYHARIVCIYITVESSTF